VKPGQGCSPLVGTIDERATGHASLVYKLLLAARLALPIDLFQQAFSFNAREIFNASPAERIADELA